MVGRDRSDARPARGGASGADGSASRRSASPGRCSASRCSTLPTADPAGPALERRPRRRRMRRTRRGAFRISPTASDAAPMPGFSAPKTALARRGTSRRRSHARGASCLPKDYRAPAAERRGRLGSRRRIGDVADGYARRHMVGGIASACGISTALLPRLVASGAVSGALRAELAARWRLRRGLPIAGGAGDNMCGAVGAGVVERGDACISLGTSGVYFVAERPLRSGARSRHAHAPPRGPGPVCAAWLRAQRRGGADLDRGIVGADVAERFLADIEAADLRPTRSRCSRRISRASARRTTIRPRLRRFSNLRMRHRTRCTLGRAVLEGVAFALADCQDALARRRRADRTRSR